ncbi:putative alpha/Beta hydrolase [Lupinus albus]|uniref:Putative alpha/Beta hydrolase n=1 Tax=Lupinus albus TaxID=3870 RepID=A0A6A4QLJ5_LUPAL|nr:putative alpha/Beta hydrolase [Lupinus albus]
MIPTDMLKRGHKSNPRNGVQNCRISVLVMSFTLMLMLVLVYLLLHTDGEESYTKTDNDSEKLSLDHEFPNPKQKWNSFDSLVKFHPTKEFRNGTDLIWQVPELSPKGVLFVAHGCNGRAINFWDQTLECPDCIGLPEERLLVLHALARGFAVITISSARTCWTYGKEVLVVKDVIEWWISKRKLEKLPLVALGASSGGYFVSVLATTMKFNSIVIMIAEGMFEEMDIKRDYPPTLFVHMPKDFGRQRKIDEYVEILKDTGIDVGVVECMEFPLSANTLSDRIPGLDQNLSGKLFEFLKEKGFVDKNGYMRRDGRAIKWKEALQEKKTVSLDKHLVPHIQEELNLAYAYHEMTSVHSDQIFKWFESHISLLDLTCDALGI